jgi:hypothetical protein
VLVDSRSESRRTVLHSAQPGSPATHSLSQKIICILQPASFLKVTLRPILLTPSVRARTPRRTVAGGLTASRFTALALHGDHSRSSREMQGTQWHISVPMERYMFTTHFLGMLKRIQRRSKQWIVLSNGLQLALSFENLCNRGLLAQHKSTCLVSDIC